jgi:hypothetical protein
MFMGVSLLFPSWGERPAIWHLVAWRAAICQEAGMGTGAAINALGDQTDSRMEWESLCP